VPCTLPQPPVQAFFPRSFSGGGIEAINLLPEDDARIVALNVRDPDLSGASGANPSTAFRSAETPGVPSNVTPGGLVRPLAGYGIQG
jgi:hypothetical protein